MRIYPVNMGVHPDHMCRCSNPAHIGLVSDRREGGFMYHDRICSQCALTLVSRLAGMIRPSRGTSKSELDEKNELRREIAKLKNEKRILQVDLAALRPSASGPFKEKQ